MYQQNTTQNRYPGVKPFRTDEKELFFGREQDIEKLFSLIFVKQIVVLYGKSGYGKSSLINAGIIPQLHEEKNWTYFNIRFNYFSESGQTANLAPVENIKLRIRQALKDSAPSPLDTLIKNEDSFWYWVKTYQYKKKKNRYIFFFDQFEELFTYPKAQVEEFSEQLSQFLYTVVPVKFRKRLAEMDESGSIQDDLYQFLYDKPEVKVVFSVRSDRLAQLNVLTDRHPTILQNCYELDALTREEAERAIVEPAFLPKSDRYLTPAFNYTDDALQKILDSVSDRQDGKIELGTLQIICRHVEEELVNGQNHTEITSDLLGNVTDIFKQHYESILNKLSPLDRFKAQHLIEDELLEGGRRNPLPDTYIQNKFGLSEDLLMQLETSSLLRKERDAAGRLLIELSHDSLIIPITAAREKRIQQENEEKARLEREAKRKIDQEIEQLQKARELAALDKKGLQLRRTETLKREVRVFRIQANLKAYGSQLKRGLISILFILIFISAIVWAVVASVKSANRGSRIKENRSQIKNNNKELEQMIQSYDSVQNPLEYRKLKELSKKYKNLE